MPFLSIVTPTYNRAHLLPECLKSLLSQTDKDFEWIIVDDGSTDDTQQVIGTFSAADFEFVYIKKENGGKHTALNAAHAHIHGQYVLILDSDDCLTGDAVEKVKREWKKWQSHKEIGIVTFLKGEAAECPVCTVRDFDTPVDILRYKRTCISGSDCCEVIRSELFLKYPFPEFQGERFIAECALWNRVAMTYKCVYVNEVIYICEYLEGGLTKSGRALRIQNPRGGMFISQLRMDRRNYFSQRVKYGLLYTCYGRFAGIGVRQMTRECRARGLMWLCLPFGQALYFYWKHKYGDHK